MNDICVSNSYNELMYLFFSLLSLNFLWVLWYFFLKNLNPQKINVPLSLHLLTFLQIKWNKTRIDLIFTKLRGHTISSMYPEKELCKSMITFLYNFVRGVRTIFSNIRRENDDTEISKYHPSKLSKSILEELCCYK